ncbi:MAG: response regulator receiver [Hyphomicrobiales bacterium]|nr:response regulator receiver [Hyphomicrobiales bacterium]
MSNDRQCARPTILVVEDDPLIRLFGADTLIDAGFEVIEAWNADEALSILQARSDINVLFTDVDMPGSLDGLELANIARRLLPQLHIIITSGRRRPAQRQLPKDGRFLEKPYAPDELARDIGAMLAA